VWLRFMVDLSLVVVRFMPPTLTARATPLHVCVHARSV
jgi:hypothetical protein